MDVLKEISDLPKDKVGMILFIIVVALFGAYKVYMAINGKKIKKAKEVRQNNEDSQTSVNQNRTQEAQHQTDATSLRDRMRSGPKPPEQ